MRTATVRQVGSFFLLLLFPGVPAAQAQLCSGSWTFGDNGSTAYRLEAQEPCCIHLGTFGNENPTLLLEVGKRYQVRVLNYTDYPLELIAKGASESRDKVLLSMGLDTGAFAADPEVNWLDDGRGTVRFTLTARLFKAMADEGLSPGYRCRAQPAVMRGDFAVTWTSPISERFTQARIVVASAKGTSGLVAPMDFQSDRPFFADLRTRQIEE